MIIEDVLLAIASLGFVGADIKQAYKLWSNYEYNVDAFSKTHFKLKLLSLSLVIVAYCSLGVYLALSIAILQFIINIYLFKRIFQSNLW